MTAFWIASALLLVHVPGQEAQGKKYDLSFTPDIGDELVIDVVEDTVECETLFSLTRKLPLSSSYTYRSSTRTTRIQTALGQLDSIQ